MKPKLQNTFPTIQMGGECDRHLQDQESTFRSVEAAMREAVGATLWLAASEIFLTLTTYEGNLQTLSGIADSANELFVAFFIWLGTRSFQAVYRTQGWEPGSRQAKTVHTTRAALLCSIGALHGAWEHG
jgi:hypothetical protein